MSKANQQQNKLMMMFLMKLHRQLFKTIHYNENDALFYLHISNEKYVIGFTANEIIYYFFP